MTDFRCSVASRDDGEPIGGTAPTDTELLMVEHAGSWGRKAVAESRLPEAVRTHLAGLDGVRVQLVRRHGGESGTGVRVFHARATDGGFAVRTVVLPGAEALLDTDLERELTAYDGPLWLVCTNGRRDRCCAEIGRPVAAALAARWPEATWETTHLGGHRFSGTLLALPSGHTLGRLDPTTAVAACAALERGDVPVGLSRGRAGLTPAEQVRELHVLAGGDPDVDVVEVPGTPRRASCADLVEKPVTRWEVRAG
ncbi:sucrase ferredoxin [Nocardioides sp. P5_C9_2]